ncbi:MAG: WcaF family extracellular polysaccharide biosynthesis acetyltransferase [Candidatus Zipacnadales bacterium]
MGQSVKGNRLPVDVRRNVTPVAYSRGAGWFRVLLWSILSRTLFAWSPRPLYGWRRWLLRAFGARLGQGVLIRPSVRVEYPWRLAIGDYSSVGDEVWLYSLDRIEIGKHCVVSQKAFLCTGSHDPDDEHMRLLTSPIRVGDGVWIGADVFVAPGVEIGELAVVGARSSVFRSLPPGMVCHGSPCRPRRPRRLPSLTDPSGLTGANYLRET